MIRFSKYLWVYFSISLIVLIIGLVTLVRFGLKPAIDFTGGTLLEVQYAGPIDESQITQGFDKENIEVASLQMSDDRTVLLRMKQDTESDHARAVLASVSAQTMEVLRDETVGPTIGSELLSKAVTAAILAVIGIMAYVAYSFRNIKYGVSAILALIHDMLVVVGLFAVFGVIWNVEVDTLFVTAFLTTMSFSVHDTIVVFDRIREYVKKGSKLSFAEICDLSLTETMGRSLANSFTILFMLVSLVALGGETVRWFAIALLIGTISGTYSSPFIATPILILWDKWEHRPKSGRKS